MATYRKEGVTFTFDDTHCRAEAAGQVWYGEGVDIQVLRELLAQGHGIFRIAKEGECLVAETIRGPIRLKGTPLAHTMAPESIPASCPIPVPTLPHRTQSVAETSKAQRRKGSVIRVYKMFSTDPTLSTVHVTSPRKLESLNLEIFSSSPKLTISQEFSLSSSQGWSPTTSGSPPYGHSPDSPSSRRRGTISVLKPAMKLTDGRNRRLSVGSAADIETTAKHLRVGVKYLQVAPNELPSHLFPGDGYELRIFLCGAVLDTPLYDVYRCTLTKDGYNATPSAALFRDVPPTLELHLVCLIFRTQTVVDNKTGTKQPCTRRPFACGILDLSSVNGLRLNNLETPYALPLWCTMNESTFWNAPQCAKAAGSDDLKLLGSGTALHLILSCFISTSETTGSLMRSLSNQQAPLLKPLNSTSVVDGARNDLYLLFKEATLPPIKKHKSYELQARVILNGKPLVCLAATSALQYEEVVSPYTVIGQSNLHWEELFCVKLPSSFLKPTYSSDRQPLLLVISVLKVDKKRKEVAKGALTLVDTSGLVIGNGMHSIQLLSTKSSRKGKDKDDKFGVLKIKTILASNQVAQNVFLAKLTRWRQMKNEELLDVLSKLSSAVDEIPQFFSETLNTLFHILEFLSQDVIPRLVFKVMVDIFDALCDDKHPKATENRAMLEQYLQSEFTGTRSADRLLYAMVDFFADFSNKRPSDLLAALRSVDYILKFVIRSHNINGGVDTSPLANEYGDKWIERLSLALQQLMQSNRPDLHGVQVGALKKLAPLFETLLDIFSSTSVAEIVKTFVLSVKINSENLKSSLLLEKLRFIGRLLSGRLMQEPQVRLTLWPILARESLSIATAEIKDCSDDIRKAAIQNFHTMVETIQRHIVNMDAELISSLLDITHHLCAFWLAGNVKLLSETTRRDMAIAILAMLYIVPHREFQKHLYASDIEYQKHFLTTMLSALTALFDGPGGSVFPTDWWELVVFQLRTTADFIWMSSHYMKSSAVGIFNHPIDNSVITLARTFLILCAKFITLPTLNPETLHASRRESLLTRWGDMRAGAAASFTSIWKVLGAVQSEIYTELIPHVVAISLSDNKSVSEQAISVFVDMMEISYECEANLMRIQTRVAESICELFTMYRKQMSQNDAQWIKNLLTSHPSSQIPDAEREQVQEAISKLLDALLAEHHAPATDYDERSYRLAKLCEQLRQLGLRKEYEQYLRLIYDMHLKNNHLVEAAYVVSLQLDILTKDEDGNSITPYPADKAEQLLRTAIQLYEKARMWEEVVEMSKKMAELLVSLYRYEEEALVHKNIAQYLLKASDNDERVWPCFFYIAYYGPCFPPHLQNREFLIPCWYGESFAAISPKLKAAYPEARVLNTVLQPHEIPPNQNIILAILASPVAQEDDSKLPYHVQRYKRMKGAKRFSITVYTNDSDIEYQVTTTDSFPNIATRLPVIERILVRTVPASMPRAVSPLMRTPSPDSSRSTSPLRAPSPMPPRVPSPMPPRGPSPIPQQPSFVAPGGLSPGRPSSPQLGNVQQNPPMNVVVPRPIPAINVNRDITPIRQRPDGFNNHPMYK